MSHPPSPGRPLVGDGDFIYEANDAWHRVPPELTFGEAVGVAVDSQDRVYVLTRDVRPVFVFDSEGNCLDSWGEGQFVRPHGITVDADDHVWICDDRGHAVRKYTPGGELVMTLGPCGTPSDSGVVNSDYRTIRRGAPPFNMPTNLAVAPGGELYVSDGYGNARVHRFSAAGELLQSWGEPGTGPGQFMIPHGIGVDGGGRVFVCDRENSRVQIFSKEGELLDIWQDVARPCNVFFDGLDNVYVAEMGWHAGTPDPHPERSGGRVSIFDRTGRLLNRWGGGADPYAAGDFIAPHDLWIDSAGSLYVGEVALSAAADRGLVTRDCPSLQKFTRRTA